MATVINAVSTALPCNRQKVVDYARHQLRKERQGEIRDEISDLSRTDSKSFHIRIQYVSLVGILYHLCACIIGDV